MSRKQTLSEVMDQIGKEMVRNLNYHAVKQDAEEEYIKILNKVKTSAKN